MRVQEVLRNYVLANLLLQLR